MSETLTVSDVTINVDDNKGHKYNYVLSVTTRDCGDTTEMMAELTYRTIKAWLWIVSKLELNDYILPMTEDGDVLGSVEDRLSNEFIDHDETMFPAVEGNSRVTVWDTFKSQSRIGFHLNSDDIPQMAVNTWLANHQAIDRILKEQPQNASKQSVEPHSSVSTPREAIATPKSQNNAQNVPSGIPAVEGVIVATRAPKSSELQYADGQLVLFTINKIETSANKGSTVFNMWSTLGTQYPTVKVYMKKPNGDLKLDYNIIKPVIDMLGFGLEKTEAVGNWQLITKVAHAKDKDGNIKEYHNTQSLTVN